MKKWLTSLLAALMLFNLAACHNTSDDTDSSSPTEESSTTEISDTSDVSNAQGENSDVSGEKTEMNYTLISVGKPYTSSLPSNEAYQDRYGQQLTDGFKTKDSGVFYTDPRMCGYTGTSRFVIDLGDDGKNINAVAVRTVDLFQDGVRRGGSVRFHGSDDGSKWKLLGNALFPDTGNQTISTARIDLDKPVDYRYIRAEVSLASGGAFYFIDEIEVYADVPEKPAVSTLEASYKSQDFESGVWKKVSTGVSATPKASINVAKGEKYTFEKVKFDSRAKDNKDTFLTDGANTTRLFGEDVWIGISAANTSSVTLTLPKIRDDLYAFKVYALNGAPGVKFADYIDVYVSDNKREFTKIGRMYAPMSGDNHTYSLLLPEYIKAKYIRFEFPEGAEDVNYWIEEIEVFAGLGEDSVSGEKFPDFNIDAPTEDVFWPSTDKDYNEKQNLLLGLSQNVASTDYRDAIARVKETGPDSKLLTDGKLASNTYCYNNEYFWTNGGNALEFFYDLGAISTVRELQISYLEQVEFGIHNPRWVTIFLSDDAQNWYPVADYTGSDYTAATPATRKTLDWALDTPYAARYVRFRVESAFFFADEFRVIGTKAVDSSTVRITESGITPVVYYTDDDQKQFASTENTPVKSKDIMLVYGNHGDEDTLLPMVAYIDEDGNIKDTFMDGFLYCMTGVFPSGLLGHLPNTKAEWEYLYNMTFNGTGGLNALEKTVEKVKTALDKPDYRVKVYFSIINVVESVTNFGDVDGDGISESLATPEGRKKVIDWYVNLCRDEFNSRGYKNLEIGGFYWLHEAITWEYDDTHIVKEVSDYVHDNGEILLWIPYNNAHRYFLTYELGFDLICLQPNIMFSDTKPMTDIEHTALTGKRRKLCVEIEHSYQAFSDPKYVKKYMAYLYYGAVTGYMKDAVHIYYDDLSNFTSLALSDDYLCRMQYDATYEFARGTLNVIPEAKPDVNVSGKADEILSATLYKEGEYSNYTLASSPAHGTVVLSENGDFLYFPDHGYTGSDSFTYTYNNYLGESEPYNVIITVK